MKIIISPDSFKGSLDAVQAAKAMNNGVLKVFPNAKTVLLPVADGGEGTLDTLVASTNGRVVDVSVVGPLGDMVAGSYGVLGDGVTCVIEMALASGLSYVSEGELSASKTTTYGTGQLIRQALDDGFTSFILALGGSATNDGGVGMLQALDMKVQDEKGEDISYGGGEIGKVHRIDVSSFDSRIKDCDFIIASDVQNPLVGEMGASRVFGPQKGADNNMVEMLDQNMTHWADEIEKVTGIHLHNRSGAGAAGGIGGAFQAFFPATMKRGIDVVLEQIRFSDALIDSDLVLTGEGQVDEQTTSGKTPMGVAQTAFVKGVPTIIIAGSLGAGIEDLYKFGVVSINSIVNKPMTLNEAVEDVKELLEASTEQIVRSFFYKQLTELKCT